MELEEAYQIVKMPYVTEKTFGLIEKQNKMVFMVSETSSKAQIKRALELMYGVKVARINTLRSHHGKKAYVTFTSDTPASELASKLGVL